ncbi:MAG: hypothetical protein JO313_17210 [Verrucomicrobia bacterium]|nr:hypothetical protein [Verrucomicrobiota bacterium]
MIEAPAADLPYPVTDGDIAVNNLESARQRSWSRFWRDSSRPGIAEYIAEQEQLMAQFVGDLTALDRLEALVNHLQRGDAESSRTALICAQVASMTHRFADARNYLAKAKVRGISTDAANRLSLSIDQACGTGLDTIIEARRQMAAKGGRLEDLVSLGALHADLLEFDEADQIYQRALREYQESSPFAVAWVCFQLGVLWHERVPQTEPSRAAHWYRRAIEYLPCYVKARVHLAEIYLRDGRAEDAEAVLIRAVSSGDPEVSWRLAEAMVAMGRSADAEAHIQIARSGFEVLLENYLLAFADHGAEFYSATGDDPLRAFELAVVNLANRPTLRAFELAYATAVGAGLSDAATEILETAKERWATLPFFYLSPLAERPTDLVNNDSESFDKSLETDFKDSLKRSMF